MRACMSGHVYKVVGYTSLYPSARATLLGPGVLGGREGGVEQVVRRLFLLGLSMRLGKSVRGSR
jgi:hypothetical protein